MQIKKLSVLALLSVFLTQNASAFCDSMNTRVTITTNPGNVKYITTLSRDEFVKKAKQKVSPNSVGLTVSNLTVKGEAEGRVETDNNRTCVSLGSVDFRMGYETGDLVVYIDKKYPSTSCEYKVTKTHEKYHVAVAQQAMLFFKPDIEKQIQKTIRNLRPQIVSTTTERDKVIQEQFQQIMSDLRPLLQHINDTIAKKNYQIDTPESYAETTALCHNW